jgi:hypothetical protein
MSSQTTLTLSRSNFRTLMDLDSTRPIKRLFVSLVLYTEKQGKYFGWDNDQLAIIGPADSIEKVRNFLDV